MVAEDWQRAFTSAAGLPAWVEPPPLEREERGAVTTAQPVSVREPT